MPAGSKVEAHEGVAGLHQRQEHALIGLAAELGWTLANRQANSFLARSMARFSAMSTNWQPP